MQPSLRCCDLPAVCLCSPMYTCTEQGRRPVVPTAPHTSWGRWHTFLCSCEEVKFSGHLLEGLCVNPFVGKRTEIVFHFKSVFEMYLLRTSIFEMKLLALCSNMDLFSMNPSSCSFQTRTRGIIVLLILLPPRTVYYQGFQEQRKASGGEGQQFISLDSDAATITSHLIYF